MYSRKVLDSLLVIALLWSGTVLAAGPEDRVYILNPKELKAIDESTFSMIEETVELPGERIIAWWNTTDQKRLALVTQKGILRIKQPAKLVVVDLESFGIVSITDLGMNPVATVRSESGRRGYVLHYGKEKKDILPTLLAVDAVNGKVTSSRVLDERPAFILLSEDESRVGLVYYGRSAAKVQKRTHARYEVLDAVTLEPLSALDLPGPVTSVTVNNIQGLAYLMDPGIDRKKMEKSVPGRLYVVDPEQGKLVSTLELGIAPGPLSWDAKTGQYYVLTQPRKSRTASAMLEIIDDGEITRRLELPVVPNAVTPSPDRSRFYVLEKDGIRIARGDLTGFGSRIELERVAGGLLQHENTDIGYVLHPESSHVTRVDLGGDMKVLSSFMTGRTSKRVGKGLAVAGAIILAAAAGGYLADSSPYYYNNPSYYYYNPVVIPYQGYAGPRTSGWYSDDGRFAYIYNTGTNDLTVYDNNRQDVVTKMPGGSKGIRFVRGGERLVTLAPKKLRLYDASSHQSLFETKFSCTLPPCGFSVHADDTHAFLWSALADVQLIDLDKGAIVKTYPDSAGQLIRLRKPVDFVPHEARGWN